MTKPTFISCKPLPGYENAPPITAEQMSRLLYESIGGETPGKIATLLNKDRNPDYYGQLQTTYVAPPKPVYAKPKRPVRINDLETGCVLRFVGHESLGPLVPEIGSEHVVTGVSCGSFRIAFSHNDWSVKGSTWTAAGWDFVSNPNYINGLDKRLTYYLKDTGQSYYKSYAGKPLKLTTANRKDGVWTDAGSWFYTKDLTTEQPAPKPTYKVRDGEVTEGDTCYWLGNYGPEKFTVGAPGTGWAANKGNLEFAPWCYQKTEPRIITEFGNPPKARYAYLETDYATKQECTGAL